MRKILIGVAAAALFSVGAAVAFAQTGGSTTTTTTTAGGSGTDSTKPGWDFGGPDRGDMLSSVLDDLVSKGTITSDQKTAILDALKAKHDDLRAQADQFRQQADQARQLWQSFWDDGELTKAEIDQLPADSPIRKALEDPNGPFASALADGKITKDELQSLKGELGRGLGGFFGGFGHRGLGGPGHGWYDGQNGGSNGPTSPSTTPSSLNGTA